MNSISWFLYLSEVANTIKMGALISLLLFSALFVSVWFFDAMEDADIQWVRRRWPICLISVFAAIALVVPTERTLLLIGASQFGEKLFASESVQSVVDPAAKVLRERLLQEIKRMAEPAK